MAKKIKFNLKFGETSIRTLSDLRENFSPDDVLDFFENGVLYKFLERRDYQEEAEKIKKLAAGQSRGDLEASLRGILDILGLSAEKDALEEYLEARRFRLERERRLAAYIDDVSKEQKVIIEYFDGYEETVKGLIENRDDLGKIRAHTKELLDHYKLILGIDHSALLERLTKTKALYPVLHMLSHDFFRNCWGVDFNFVEGEEVVRFMAWEGFINSINSVTSRQSGGTSIPWLIKADNKKFSQHWEDIEVRGKKYMILHAPPQAKIREPNDVKNEFTANEIISKFKTFDGIQFRCQAKSNPLIYVEV